MRMGIEREDAENILNQLSSNSTDLENSLMKLLSPNSDVRGVSRCLSKLNVTSLEQMDRAVDLPLLVQIGIDEGEAEQIMKYLDNNSVLKRNEGPS